MTRAQRRMMVRVLRNPGYTPSRSSTRRTARILLEHEALKGSTSNGLYSIDKYGLDKEGLFERE